MPEQRALGNILIRHGVVAPEALEPLYEQQREKRVPLVDLLIQSQAANEETVMRALAAECGLPVVERIDVGRGGGYSPIAYMKPSREPM